VLDHAREAMLPDGKIPLRVKITTAQPV
jgi:hypothetical protein